MGPSSVEICMDLASYSISIRISLPGFSQKIVHYLLRGSMSWQLTSLYRQLWGIFGFTTEQFLRANHISGWGGRGNGSTREITILHDFLEITSVQCSLCWRQRRGKQWTLYAGRGENMYRSTSPLYHSPSCWYLCECMFLAWILSAIPSSTFISLRSIAQIW